MITPSSAKSPMPVLFWFHALEATLLIAEVTPSLWHRQSSMALRTSVARQWMVSGTFLRRL